MTEQIKFALNHITAPALDSRQFVDLAARLGCMGVELRNDLADKELTSRPFFDGVRAAEIGDYARSKGIRLLGLSEVYGFNRWSDAVREKVQLLISQAKESGAETISLIPSNDGADEPKEERLTALREALSAILPMLEEHDLIGLVEPLGFATSSLRHKREAVEVFKAVGGNDRFRLVHDTFHHYLAGETEFFPEWTGIVHISGVVDVSLRAEDMQDKHRVLVTGADCLGNFDQIKHLGAIGYRGAYSFELFSPLIHANPRIEAGLQASMDDIRTALDG